MSRLPRIVAASLLVTSAAQAQETVRLTLIDRPDTSAGFCFYRGQARGLDFILWTVHPRDLTPCPAFLDFPVEDLDDVPQFERLPGGVQP